MEIERENQSEYYYNKLKNLIFNDDFSKKIGLEKLDNWATRITKTFIYAALNSNDALEINMKENKDCDIRCAILNAIEINNEIKLNLDISKFLGYFNGQPFDNLDVKPLWLSSCKKIKDLLKMSSYIVLI